jgi:hypothetical protein
LPFLCVRIFCVEVALMVDLLIMDQKEGLNLPKNDLNHGDINMKNLRPLILFYKWSFRFVINIFILLLYNNLKICKYKMCNSLSNICFFIFYFFYY